MFRLPIRFTLFPYTTLFRSKVALGGMRPHGSGKVWHLGNGNPDSINKVGMAPQVTIRESDVPALQRGLTIPPRSEEHTSELQSLRHLVCRLLLEKKKVLQKF